MKTIAAAVTPRRTITAAINSGVRHDPSRGGSAGVGGVGWTRVGSGFAGVTAALGLETGAPQARQNAVPGAIGA
jgi:hypothetical protein